MGQTLPGYCNRLHYTAPPLTPSNDNYIPHHSQQVDDDDDDEARYHQSVPLYDDCAMLLASICSDDDSVMKDEVILQHQEVEQQQKQSTLSIDNLTGNNNVAIVKAVYREYMLLCTSVDIFSFSSFPCYAYSVSCSSYIIYCGTRRFDVDNVVLTAAATVEVCGIAVVCCCCFGCCCSRCNRYNNRCCCNDGLTLAELGMGWGILVQQHHLPDR